jgi:hypothetical protein
MPLKSKIKVSLQAEQTANNDYGTVAFNPVLAETIDLLSGTLAGQADLIFADERTVATGANDDLDLAGVLANALGGVLANVEIVAILLINKSKAGPANTTNLTIGGGTNPFIGFLGGTVPVIGPIRPGGVVLLACPADVGIGAVVAGTGDILRITNSAGASNTYQIAILGRSA